MSWNRRNCRRHCATTRLAALGDAWATHQGQLAAVQRRQRALESQAQLPELEKSPGPGREPLERLQAQWTALHGSEPDDLAARLDELRRQTDSLERQQAPTRNGNRPSTNAPAWLDAWANSTSVWSSRSRHCST